MFTGTRVLWLNTRVPGEETEVSWSAQLDLWPLPCHSSPGTPQKCCPGSPPSPSYPSPGLCCGLGPNKGVEGGSDPALSQSSQFCVEKLFSGKVSPHFPSAPGGEELIAHPQAKFPPLDPPREQNWGTPSQPSPSGPIPCSSNVGRGSGCPSTAATTGTAGRCWQEKQGFIKTHRQAPSAPHWGAQQWERAPPKLP